MREFLGFLVSTGKYAFIVYMAYLFGHTIYTANIEGKLNIIAATLLFMLTLQFVKFFKEYS